MSLPPKTMNKRLPDSVRTVYGHVNGSPVKLRIPVRVFQVRTEAAVRASAIGKTHAVAVDGSITPYMYEQQDITSARPAGFVELDRKAYEDVRGAFEKKRTANRRAIAQARAARKGK